MTGDGRWIGRAQALERLGVKTQTLYAYVSRGRITAQPDPANPRRSLYCADDIARLLGDAPTPSLPLRRAPLRGEVELRSSVGHLFDGRIFYRGLDAIQLAAHATLEDTARRLWDARDTNPFALTKPRVDAVTGVSIRTRLFATLARRAEEDGSSLGQDAAALQLGAASVLNEAVDAAAGPGPRLHFHQRLARGWKVLDRDAHLIRRALVLAADFGMDAPAIAARAAAQGGAPLSGAAMAGLTALVGSTLARDVAQASAWVVEARRDPLGTSARRRTAGGSIPGFGDPAWSDGDPRARALIEAADLPRDLIGVIQHGETMMEARPTFPLALAILARRLDLPRDGALELLMLGKLAGLLAHAIDQRIDGSPIRVRLRYVGPEPGAN